MDSLEDLHLLESELALVLALALAIRNLAADELGAVHLLELAGNLLGLNSAATTGNLSLTGQTVGHLYILTRDKKCEVR